MSMGTATESTTASLAEWAAQVKYEDLPRRVVEEAKNQILSVIGAVHAGHFSEAGRIVSRTVRDWGSGRDSTMIPSGERTSLHYALFANAALSMALDYDDYLFGGHTGHAAVLVPLAVAEKVSVNGKELLVAQVVANELGGRLGAALLAASEPGARVSVVHSLAAAVAATKLLGGNATQIHSAIALALAQPTLPLTPAALGSDARVVFASTTLSAAAQAAQLAMAGLRASVEAIGGPQGLVCRLSPQPLMGAFNGLGKTWLTETLSYKLYPGCAHLDAVIDCVLGIQRQHPLDVKKVREVRVTVAPSSAQVEAALAPYLHGLDSSPTTLSASIAYNVAAALIDKELTARQLQKDRVNDAATWSLADRVRVVADEGLGQRLRDRSPIRVLPDGEKERLFLDLGATDLVSYRVVLSARVRVDMEDGRSFEMEQEVPIGAAGRPFDERRRCAEDKFRRETRYTLRKERIDKAVDSVVRLEQASSQNLRELLKLSCSERI